MRVIPVIDLQHGQVVHAVRGQRHCYQAIAQHSVLTNCSEPTAVLEALLRLHPFDTVYIADLDAISGSGTHAAIINGLISQFPSITFWIDNGAVLTETPFYRAANTLPVIGTESQTATEPFAVQFNYVLSLDFNQQPLGNRAWFSNSDCWPAQIIVMQLSRVGSNNGPDVESLQRLRRQHPDKQFIAAGGVRDADDLDRLAACGISHALLATALHTGAISAADLAKR
jgi:phosphoribosylformimino-5-aminoimidazole carboxamide ribotide isomerase